MSTLSNIIKYALDSKLFWDIAILAILIPLIISLWTSSWAQKEHAFEAKVTLLSALEKELSFMAVWAKDSYDNLSLEDYQKNNQHFDWYNPAWHLFSFNHNIVSNLLQSAIRCDISSNLIEDMIVLNQSITIVYERQDELKRYIYAFPGLYQKGILWWRDMVKKYPDIRKSPKKEYYTEILKSLRDIELRNYLFEIYGRNYRIYVDGIGGKSNDLNNPSIEKMGFHYFWAKSIKLVEDEKAKLKKPRKIIHFGLPVIIAILILIVLSYIAYHFKININ